MRKLVILITVLALLIAAVPTFAQDMEEEMVRIRVAHFSPDTPAVDVYVNGEAAITELAFPQVTSWIALPAGTYNLAVAPAGTALEEAAIGPADFELPAGAYLTIAATGSLEAGSLAPTIISEDYADIAEGNARVTVFHAIEDAPAVDVLAGESAVVSNLAFNASAMIDVPAGAYDLAVVPTGEMEPVVLDLAGTELMANTNYFVAAVGSLAEPQVVVKATFQGTLVDLAVSDERFSTLVAAVQVAGLAETLSGEGPYTIFAPTNDAFAAALESLGISAEDLLADTETLTNILLYHVAEGKLLAADVIGLETITSLQGADITVSASEMGVSLNDSIQVIETDLEASNGVIHVIDGVLLPPAAE
ncbi:MAG: DUF4397 domain-containing protein [Chloroflexi bacterium]|nr:DUF4397 domain-containing protein [Chloroflexota bacterium]